MKRIFLSLNFLFICYFASAQDQKDVNIEDLRTPTSPGFILLDQAPTTVEKPTTAKAFTVNLFNAIYENNGIPKNFGMEVAPAWFLRGISMNSYKFYGIKKTTDSEGKTTYKQKPLSQVRWGSISFAAVARDTAENVTSSTNSNIALGARTTFLSFYSKKNKDKIVQLDSMISHIFLKAIADASIEFPNAEDSIKLSERIREINDRMTPYEDTLRDVINDKLFALDGALAYSWAFENLNYESGRFGRLGAWLTGGFTFPIYGNQRKVDMGHLNAILLARYLADNNTYKAETKNYVKQDLFDYGGRLGYEKGNISLSYELVYRVNGTDKEKNTFRHGALIQYKVRDGLYLSGTIGKNFGNINNLMSFFGINWGFGKERISVPERE